MNKLEALGNKIRELREKRSWSLDRLSEELEKEDIEIVPSTLFRIEKGQRKKIDTLLLLGLSKILNYNFFQMLDNQIFKSEDYIEIDDQKLYIYGFASAGNGYLDTTDYEIMEVSLLTIVSCRGNWTVQKSQFGQSPVGNEFLLSVESASGSFCWKTEVRVTFAFVIIIFSLILPAKWRRPKPSLLPMYWDWILA